MAVGPARQGSSYTYGGVYLEGSSKAELYARALDLDIRGRSQMNKEQLASAIARQQ